MKLASIPFGNMDHEIKLFVTKPINTGREFDFCNRFISVVYKILQFLPIISVR